jgi:asparagine synthase (glutamine-hydrolysing)
MSGITGICSLDGCPVDPGDVRRMGDVIAHRGPDGAGVWCEGPIGLGHRMLFTTPESLHEKLPFVSPAGDFSITADARIDNRDELIPLLNFHGRPREGISDSEIVLAAYERWGEASPGRLLGDFSFVIWDRRKRRLFCARDPIGIKPFYYHLDGKAFRWASEPGALFEDGTIPKEPNLPLICLYLLDRFDEREETLYKNIYRLPASHFIVIEDGKLRKGKYWDIDPNRSIRCKTDGEYAEHFLDLLKEAVRAQLRSHRPVGLLLSGGLDSSTIACTAEWLHREKWVPDHGFETFSLVYDRLPCDERSFVAEVVKKWDLKANYVTYEENLPWVDFERIQQFPDVAYYPTILGYGPIYQMAQQKGMKVILDGLGGDNVLAVGFDHLTDLFFRGNLFKLFSQLKSDSRVFSTTPLYLFLKYCLKPLVPRAVKSNLKRFLGRDIPAWINRDYLRRAGVYERLQPSVRALTFPTRSQQQIYEELFNGWDSNIAQTISEGFLPRFGLENRHPFFDRRIIEFLIALPEEQRWRKESPKWILREAMDGILPELVRQRKDIVTFTSTLSFELKERQAHKLQELIRTSHLAAWGVIHPDRIQELFMDYRKGKGYGGVVLEQFVWLELWLRGATNRIDKEEKNGREQEFSTRGAGRIPSNEEAKDLPKATAYGI